MLTPLRDSLVQQSRRYDHPTMRRLAPICAAVAVAAWLLLGAVGGASAGASLKRDSPPGGGYTVELPPSWRFANASYPSDHVTHLWFDPANALRRLLVVVSGCVCARPNGRPDPAAGVPANPLHVVPLSGTEDAFEVFTDDDPWVADGLSIDILSRGRPAGYASVEVWLPPGEHALATTILNSFRVTG
jgi:hypothetical protein